MKVAIPVKNIPSAGSAALYWLSEPHEGFEHVLVSGLPAYGEDEPAETFIFPADEDGEILGWDELHGSFVGGMDHYAALNGAGYEVIA